MTQRFGVEIVPLVGHSPKGKSNRQKFVLYAVPFTPKTWFVTNAATSKEMARQKMVRKRIGYLTFSMDHVGKRINVLDYYPVDHMPSLKGLGIASLVELAIGRKLLREFPDYSVISATNPKAARVQQLRKRGRDPGKPVLLVNDVRALQERVKENARRYRPIVRR